MANASPGYSMNNLRLIFDFHAQSSLHPNYSCYACQSLGNIIK